MLMLLFLPRRVRNGRMVAVSGSEDLAKIIYRETQGLQGADTVESYSYVYYNKYFTTYSKIIITNMLAWTLASELTALPLEISSVIR